MEEDEDGLEEEEDDDLLLELPTDGGAKAPGNWSMAAAAATNPKPTGVKRQQLPARRDPGKAGKCMVWFTSSARGTVHGMRDLGAVQKTGLEVAACCWPCPSGRQLSEA
jgi:hypothetical protein